MKKKTLMAEYRCFNYSKKLVYYYCGADGHATRGKTTCNTYDMEGALCTKQTARIGMWLHFRRRLTAEVR